MTRIPPLARIVLLVLVSFDAGRPSASALGQGPPASVEGVVVAADTRQPIAAATVRALYVSPVEPGATRPDPVEAITGTDGRFVLRGLTPGRIELTVRASGFVTGRYRPTSPSQAPAFLPGEHRSGIVIRLERAVVISGIVRDAHGAPMPGVGVQIFQRGILTARRVWLSARAEFTTDASGRYTSADAPPGEYVVSVPVRSTTAPEDVVNLVRGVTSAEAGTAPQLRSLAESVRRMPAAALPVVDGFVQSITNGTGSRPLPSPGPGPGGAPRVYRTTYHPSATTLNAAAIVELRSGERRDDVDVMMQTSGAGRIRGRLVDAAGEPAGFIALHLIATDADEISHDYDVEIAATASGADGHFSFFNVPEGRYEVKVVLFETPEGRTRPVMPAADWLRAWAVAAVTVDGSGGEAVIRTLALRPPIIVSGRLIFAGAGAGQPATSTAIWMAAVDGGMHSPPARVRPDADGRFALAGAMRGRYHLWGGSPAGWTVTAVTAGGRDITLSALELVDRGVDDVEIRLTSRTVGVSGRVLDTEGRPVSNASVVAFPADHGRWIDGGLSIRGMRSSRSSPAGTFTLAGLPPGPYLVAAFADGALIGWPDRRVVEAVAQVADLVLLEEGRLVARDLTAQTAEIRPSRR